VFQLLHKYFIYLIILLAQCPACFLVRQRPVILVSGVALLPFQPEAHGCTYAALNNILGFEHFTRGTHLGLRLPGPQRGAWCRAASREFRALARRPTPTRRSVSQDYLYSATSVFNLVVALVAMEAMPGNRHACAASGRRVRLAVGRNGRVIRQLVPGAARAARGGVGEICRRLIPAGCRRMTIADVWLLAPSVRQSTQPTCAKVIVVALTDQRARHAGDDELANVLSLAHEVFAFHTLLLILSENI